MKTKQVIASDIQWLTGEEMSEKFFGCLGGYVIGAKAISFYSGRNGGEEKEFRVTEEEIKTAHEYNKSINNMNRPPMAAKAMFMNKILPKKCAKKEWRIRRPNSVKFIKSVEEDGN